MPVPGVVWWNCPHMASHDGLEVTDLTRADLEGRERIAALLAFLRAKPAGFKDVFVIDVAPQLGIRQTRLLEGLYVVTKDDVTGRRHLPIGRARARRSQTLSRVAAARACNSWSPAGIIPPPRRRSASARDPPASRWARPPASPRRLRSRPMSGSTNRRRQAAGAPARARRRSGRPAAATHNSPSQADRKQVQGTFRNATAVGHEGARLHAGHARTGATQIWPTRRDVINIERPGRPTFPAPRWPTIRIGLNNSVFRSLNLIMRSIALDLRSWREAIVDHLAGADVVVTVSAPA